MLGAPAGESVTGRKWETCWSDGSGSLGGRKRQQGGSCSCFSAGKCQQLPAGSPDEFCHRNSIFSG